MWKSLVHRVALPSYNSVRPTVFAVNCVGGSTELLREQNGCCTGSDVTLVMLPMNPAAEVLEYASCKSDWSLVQAFLRVGGLLWLKKKPAGG